MHFIHSVSYLKSPAYLFGTNANHHFLPPPRCLVLEDAHPRERNGKRNPRRWYQRLWCINKWVVPARHSYLPPSYHLSLPHKKTKLQEVVTATLHTYHVVKKVVPMRDSNSSPVNCHLYLTPTGERDYTRWCQWPDSINIATVPVTSCHVPVGPHSSEDHLACMNPLTRLSNHVYPPTIRSSAALGDIHPTQRTFDRNSSGCGARVHIGHGNAERFESWCPPPRQPSELRANQLDAGAQVCRQIHPPADIRSIPARDHQVFFACRPCVLAAQHTALHVARAPTRP